MRSLADSRNRLVVASCAGRSLRDQRPRQPAPPAAKNLTSIPRKYCCQIISSHICSNITNSHEPDTADYRRQKAMSTQTTRLRPLKEGTKSDAAWLTGFCLSRVGVIADCYGAKKTFLAGSILASTSALLFAFCADSFLSGLMLYGFTGLCSGATSRVRSGISRDAGAGCCAGFAQRRPSGYT